MQLSQLGWLREASAVSECELQAQQSVYLSCTPRLERKVHNDQKVFSE